MRCVSIKRPRLRRSDHLSVSLGIRVDSCNSCLAFLPKPHWIVPNPVCPIRGNSRNSRQSLCFFGFRGIRLSDFQLVSIRVCCRSSASWLKFPLQNPNESYQIQPNRGKWRTGHPAAQAAVKPCQTASTTFFKPSSQFVEIRAIRVKAFASSDFGGLGLRISNWCPFVFAADHRLRG